MLSRINWQTPIESRDGSPGDATSSASKSKARAVPAHNGVRLHVDLVFAAPRPNEATPAVVGGIAQEAGGGQLIVSHFGLFNRDAISLLSPRHCISRAPPNAFTFRRLLSPNKSGPSNESWAHFYLRGPNET